MSNHDNFNLSDRAHLEQMSTAELEGLLARHRDLKANMRALELAHRELQGR